MSTNPVRIIDVRKQHAMSFRETWMLCLRGVKHRLLRSLLTLAVVVLAVAFFMFLLSESMFQRAVAAGVREESEDARFAQTTLTRILSYATDAVSVRRLSALANGFQEKASPKALAASEATLTEAAAVTGLSVKEIRDLAESAAQEEQFTAWIASLPTGHRLNLVGKRFGRNAFSYILETREEFHRQIAIKIEIRVPGGLEELDVFLADYPAYLTRISDYTKRWNAAIAKANEITDRCKGNANLAESRWIPGSDLETLEVWRKELTSLGFLLSFEQLQKIRSQLAQVNEYNDFIDKISEPKFREDWAKAFVEAKRSTAEEKFPLLFDKRALPLLQEHFSMETITRCDERFRTQMRLSQLEHSLAAVTKMNPVFLGLTGRQIFLLVISFLVCMVGIANAMLMSITERFREIATMKCLGATDSYILMQFMMEAALQGFAGGIIGVFVGFCISFLRCAILYGAHLWTYFPGTDVLFCGIFSLVTGILLAALASIQPSWSASRMAPMEAMRVE